jgi:hypothetical protein
VLLDHAYPPEEAESPLELPPEAARRARKPLSLSG